MNGFVLLLPLSSAERPTARPPTLYAYSMPRSFTTFSRLDLRGLLLELRLLPDEDRGLAPDRPSRLLGEAPSLLLLLLLRLDPVPVNSVSSSSHVPDCDPRPRPSSPPSLERERRLLDDRRFFLLFFFRDLLRLRPYRRLIQNAAARRTRPRISRIHANPRVKWRKKRRAPSR